jgi:hypothetical protein
VRLLPGPVRDGIRAGAIAALFVLAAGAAATGLALALSAGVAGKMIDAYGTGVVGQAGLILACALYAPTASVWAASYLVGPGFSIGAGTTISAAAVTMGPVPALPIFAAVPDRPLPFWGTLLLGVPLAAGMAAGWLLARQRRDASWSVLLGTAALTGPVAGALLAFAVVASSGSLGGDRLSTLGATAWPLAGVGAAVVAAGATVAAAAAKAIVAVRRPGPG